MAGAILGARDLTVNKIDMASADSLLSHTQNKLILGSAKYCMVHFRKDKGRRSLFREKIDTEVQREPPARGKQSERLLMCQTIWHV